MVVDSKIQHRIAACYYPQVFHSSFLPIGKSPFKERKSGANNKIIRKQTAVFCSQGTQNAENSTFKAPKLVLPVEERADPNTKNGIHKRSLFQVILTTSKDYGSGISDPSAGVLLALIGESGSCFVHRLASLDTSDQNSHSFYRFQRGGQDVISFSGPDLGRLAAAWLAPEQGTWRIQNLAVRVCPELLNKDNAAAFEHNGNNILQYNFACEEALVGEDEPMPAAELQVSSISKISYEDFLHVDPRQMADGLQATSIQGREEGMREYEVLKFSLLRYDAILVIAGSAIAAVAGHPEVSEGFLIGGILGFFYLLILERAVDQLPAPSSSTIPASTDKDVSATNTKNNNTGKQSSNIKTSDQSRMQSIEKFNGFRAPLTRLSGFLAVGVLIAKAVNTENQLEFSKEILLAGAAGFSMTKIATVLASNIPFKIRHEPVQNQ